MTPILVSGPRAVRNATRLFALLATITLLPAAGATAGQRPDLIQSRQAVAAPSGSQDLCGRYRWACAHTGVLNMSDTQALRIAKSVNGAVNRGTRPISDHAQYGVAEFWTLPTSRGGDCEDLVLLKKKALMAQGVSPDRLLIATVLDRNRSSHAVLVLRTAAEDYVLDSLVGSIKPWRATGYSFLKMQDPASPSHWKAIFSGGIFSTGA